MQSAGRPSRRCGYPPIAGEMPGQPTLWKKNACGTLRKKIGVCGGWCCRSRIEGAFLSGAALAGRILGAAGMWR
jgi:hypothetical protein